MMSDPTVGSSPPGDTSRTSPGGDVPDAPDLTRTAASTSDDDAGRSPADDDTGPGASDDASAPTVVHARGLTHLYDDTHGLHEVDLDVPEGQILGVVGPSGSGKTTLARLILGLLEPDAGTIEVLGTRPWEADRYHHKRLGYLTQGTSLDPGLSLRHNLDFMASLQGLPWRASWLPGKDAKRARARIDDILELVELTGEQDTRLGRASGGEQRRLALAAAIVHDPELLVLDEPTAGIDPVLRSQLWDYFTALRDDGHTLVITTQYVTEADLCDRVALMVDGRIIRVDDPDGMRRDAFGGSLLDVEHASVDPARQRVEEVEGVIRLEDRLGPRRVRYLVDDDDGIQARITELFDRDGLAAPVLSWHRPSFDDVFVTLVEAHREGADDADGEEDADA